MIIKHFKNDLYFSFFKIKLFNRFKIKQATRLQYISKIKFKVIVQEMGYTDKICIR